MEHGIWNLNEEWAYRLLGLELDCPGGGPGLPLPQLQKNPRRVIFEIRLGRSAAPGLVVPGRLTISPTFPQKKC